MSKKPNILYIFSDQHRKFDLGCYGHPFVKTPNLDNLAKEGLRFEHCVSNSPVCVPARGTLLTGLFAGKHKAFTNDIAVDPSCESIADVLKGVGYHTGYIGKWHLAGIPRDQAVTEERRLGFEEWKVSNCNHHYLKCNYYDENNIKYNVEGYEPEIFGEMALHFLDRNTESEKPWALYLSFATPHDPFETATSEYRKLYEDIDIELRENITDQVRQSTTGSIPIAKFKELTRGYFGHVSAVDHQVGLIIKKLEAMGELENTIVIYSSDHGDMLGSQGEKDKQSPYEESIGIPLIAYWKNHIYQGVSEELIGLDDLPVTLAGLVDTNFTGETDGKNLKDIFLDPNAESYHSAYLYDYYPCHQAESKGMKAWRGIRTKRYTYAVQPNNLDWVLFDNEVDPYQMNNLAGKEEYAQLQKELWEELEAHILKHDMLLEGLDYVVYANQVEEFNQSQLHFNRKIFVE